MTHWASQANHKHSFCDALGFPSRYFCQQLLTPKTSAIHYASEVAPNPRWTRLSMSGASGPSCADKLSCRSALDPEWTRVWGSTRQKNGWDVGVQGVWATACRQRSALQDPRARANGVSLAWPIQASSSTRHLQGLSTVHCCSQRCASDPESM